MPNLPKLNSKKLLGSADKLIEKIPPHLRDLIQKASIALAALLALFLIFWAVNKGSNDAIPGGLQLAGSNKDLFYLKELREENDKRRQLIEDVETNVDEFPSRSGMAYEPAYKPMGKDLMDHLAGEKDELIEPEHALRPREKSPGYATDNDFVTKRAQPDKKILGDEETDLLRPDQVKKTEKAPVAKVNPDFLEESDKDIFAPEPSQALKPVVPKVSASPEKKVLPQKKSQQLDFLE